MENSELSVIGPSIGFRETRRIKGRKSADSRRCAFQKENVKTAWQEADGSRKSIKAPTKMATYIDVKEGKLV